MFGNRFFFTEYVSLYYIAFSTVSVKKKIFSHLPLKKLCNLAKQEIRVSFYFLNVCVNIFF